MRCVCNPVRRRRRRYRVFVCVCVRVMISCEINLYIYIYIVEMCTIQCAVRCPSFSVVVVVVVIRENTSTNRASRCDFDTRFFAFFES